MTLRLDFGIGNDLLNRFGVGWAKFVFIEHRGHEPGEIVIPAGSYRYIVVQLTLIVPRCNFLVLLYRHHFRESGVDANSDSDDEIRIRYFSYSAQYCI